MDKYKNTNYMEVNTRDAKDFLRAYCNLFWLRPESVLWDTIPSTKISKYKMSPPSLDLGCGNGIFSFITAGGNFSIDYDWFINVDPAGFWEDKDIYDVCKIDSLENYIVTKPIYTFTYGLDYKPNLLKQARGLSFYENLVEHDANQPLPFKDRQFKTVFSNILYCLRDPKRSVEEIYRILGKDGIAILCLPNIKYFDYCFTYQWKKKNSSLLKRLNRGRSENTQWTTTYDEFAQSAKNVGFKIIDHSYHYSKLTLTVWDIGLRPISPLLIKMANALNPETRRAIKSEWVETLIELLSPLYDMEMRSKEEGGYHFFVLSK